MKILGYEITKIKEKEIDVYFWGTYKNGVKFSIDKIKSMHFKPDHIAFYRKNNLLDKHIAYASIQEYTIQVMEGNETLMYGRT